MEEVERNARQLEYDSETECKNVDGIGAYAIYIMVLILTLEFENKRRAYYIQNIQNKVYI